MALRSKVIILFICGFMFSVIVAWLWLSDSQPGRLRLSVQFVGYTNVSYGMHVGVLQVSNASPFAVVRGRSSTVVFHSPSAPASYAPTGWNVLEPGESERVMTEPLTNRMGWRFVVAGERLGDDSYGIGREARSRTWMRRVAFWLQGHRVNVPSLRPLPGLQFSSDWIEP